MAAEGARSAVTHELKPETLVAVRAVERALAIVVDGVTAADVRSKGPLDVVTTADLAVEDLVRNLIGAELDVSVVGEERGGEPSGSTYWLVDPICGTRNFASGIPLCCVNAALVENDVVVAAVVGDPSNGEVYVAEQDRGAWLVGDGGPTRTSVDDTSDTLVIESGRATGERLEDAARFTAEAMRAARWELRNLSTTLSLAYVATGKVSAYVVFQASALHTGAGSLLASEAGAIVTDVDGRPWTIHSDSILAAATPALLDELLRLRRRQGEPPAHSDGR